jgi:hypothetical protein
MDSQRFPAVLSAFGAMIGAACAVCRKAIAARDEAVPQRPQTERAPVAPKMLSPAIVLYMILMIVCGSVSS